MTNHNSSKRENNGQEVEPIDGAFYWVKFYRRYLFEGVKPGKDPEYWEGAYWEIGQWQAALRYWHTCGSEIGSTPSEVVEIGPRLMSLSQIGQLGQTFGLSSAVQIWERGGIVSRRYYSDSRQNLRMRDGSLQTHYPDGQWSDVTITATLLSAQDYIEVSSC